MQSLDSELLQAVERRRSIRSYTDEPLSHEHCRALQEAIDDCNREGGLAISLVCEEPQAFASVLARYGTFSQVRNYMVLAGEDNPGLEERCGYYGEMLVLLAQMLGLSTCWVGRTYKRRLVKKMIPAGDRLVAVIAVGHGAGAGIPHASKIPADVSTVPAGMETPRWFEDGVDLALMAPTALNRQNFVFDLMPELSEDGRPTVLLRSTGGPYADTDRGIVRLHFELGAGVRNFAWA